MLESIAYKLALRFRARAKRITLSSISREILLCTSVKLELIKKANGL
jgi:hypothetical protein